MVNKRQVFVSIQSQSSIRSADELQAALNSGRSFISTNMRPGSSVSGGSSAGAPHDEKPKRKRQRLDHLTQDEKVMRRKMKNRMAAQTARDRKKVKMTDLEVEVNRLASNNEQLVKQNMALKQRLAALTTENTRMRSKLEELGHEDVESVTPNLVGILNEVQEDLDLDEILKPFMADGDCSDISSDDSGYLFSDYSGSNLNADSGSLKIKAGNANVVTGTQNSLTSSIDLDDKDALESAAGASIYVSSPIGFGDESRCSQQQQQQFQPRSAPWCANVDPSNRVRACQSGEGETTTTTATKTSASHSAIKSEPIDDLFEWALEDILDHSPSAFTTGNAPQIDSIFKQELLENSASSRMECSASAESGLYDSREPTQNGSRKSDSFSALFGESSHSNSRAQHYSRALSQNSARSANKIGQCATIVGNDKRSSSKRYLIDHTYLHDASPQSDLNNNVSSKNPRISQETSESINKNNNKQLIDDSDKSSIHSNQDIGYESVPSPGGSSTLSCTEFQTHFQNSTNTSNTGYNSNQILFENCDIEQDFLDNILYADQDPLLGFFPDLTNF